MFNVHAYLHTKIVFFICLQIVDGSRDLSRIFFQGVHMESEVKLGRERVVNWGASDTF